MALINCPECGKSVSDRASACPFCGCPIGPANNGTLRVLFVTWLKILGDCSITVDFEGQSFRLTRGYYKDFRVPADGKTHTARITCHHLWDTQYMSVTLHSGESKKVTVTYNDGNLFSKWEYREEFLVTH